MKKLLLLAAASPLALTACNGAITSEPISRVRVLAIQATPASALPGESVHLRALVVSPRRDDPSVTVKWYVCQYSSEDDCAKKNDLQQIGTGTDVDVTMPADAQAGAVAVWWLDALRPGDPRERALKSVLVRAPQEKANQNPRLDRSYWGVPQVGQPDPGVIDVHRKARVPVHVASSTVMNELYLDENGETASEPVEVRTFASGGELIDASGTGASGALDYKAPDAEGSFGAWVVVADGRGGTDWTQEWFDVKGAPQP